MSKSILNKKRVANNISNSTLNPTQKATIRHLLSSLKSASVAIAQAGANARNSALRQIANLLESKRDAIKQANALDIANARENGLSYALIQRLILDDRQIDSMIKSVLEIEAQSEVVGEILGGGVRPSGINITKISTPLGVVAIVYESRPNVTIDAAALCIKSGNAALLKGGKEASYSNEILGEILKEALESVGLKNECLLVITPKLAQNLINQAPTKAQHNSQDFTQSIMQEIMIEIMQSREFVDLLIPRGGRGLVSFVLEYSKVPVIFHEAGVCHAYIDKEAHIQQAIDICHNAKVSRPSACNAIECVLIHTQIAREILPQMVEKLGASGVEMRVCQRGLKILQDFGDLAKKKDFRICKAKEVDFGVEFGELILAIKIVESINEALAHIAKYGSKHSEIIITQNLQTSQYFCANVDASAVFVNASSRFNDGGEFGLGAEIGISTQKLHARGPMGAKDLTTTKYIVQGQGNIRK